jgi:H+/Cl- antiporter ClcA
LLITALVGILAGTASALFLYLLDLFTALRESNLWLIALLPFAGLLIGTAYHYWGEEVVKGNNLLFDEYQNPKKTIPFKMAPMVLLGTLITHLFGGSAGREGTAVQMAAAISDQFSRFFKPEADDRKMLIIIGISAGFASVFGTPWAGAVFAIEVLVHGKIRYKAIIPALLSAFIADYTCTAWNISHTHYTIPSVPGISIQNMAMAASAGIIFGLTAFLFTVSNRFWASTFKSTIPFAPFRPLTGGIFIAIAVWLLGNTRYIGLGVPIIQQAFTENLNSYDFLMKILFTTFTIGAGFKGGEVTPLFYIGAALGNTLVWIFPLPMALLAGMGFVAVFAGTTNTPLACAIMGIELFGFESAPFIVPACYISSLFSGPSGIYSSQKIGGLKLMIYERLNLIKKQSLSS